MRRDTKNLGSPSIHGGPKKATDDVLIKPSISSCGQFITPECLRSLYSIYYNPVATDKNSFGIGKIPFNLSGTCLYYVYLVEFTPQSFLGSDLDVFFKFVDFPLAIVQGLSSTTFRNFSFSNSQVGSRPKPIFIDGAQLVGTNTSFDINLESDLDMEYAMALTYPQPVTLLQTGDIVEGARKIIACGT